jgi:hypothetical protein
MAEKRARTDEEKMEAKIRKVEREEDAIWKAESAAAGLAGLTVKEAALGALKSPLFQSMPDPIFAVSTHRKHRNSVM